jgi:type VI secretion system protein VasI
MRKKTLACFLLIFTFAVANSQDSGLLDELKQAGTITDTSLRLNTYDSILEKHGLKENNSTADVGKWAVSTKVNPIDDSQVILFVLTADSGEGVYGGPIVLVIRYNNQETEVYINWSSYMGRDAYVTLRVGQETAQQDEWMMSSDSKATFYPGNTIELIKRMLTGDKLVAQSTPYSENPITAIFDIKGLKNATAPYVEVMGW